MATEYKVTQTGTNEYRVKEQPPAGPGSYVFIGIIVVIVILIIKMLSPATPHTDGSYDITNNTTEYYLREPITLSCSHSYGYEVFPISGYDTFWYEGYSQEKTITLAGKFHYITGTINLPTVYCSRCDTYENVLSFFAHGGDTSYGITEAAEQRRRDAGATMTSEIQQITRNRNSFVVEIWGDNQLLYTSPILIHQNSPLSFNINTSGVHELKFRYRGIYYVFGSGEGVSSVTIGSLYGHTD